MLDQSWATVLDAGPKLNQHWVSVSCLLERQHNGVKDLSRTHKRYYIYTGITASMPDTVYIIHFAFIISFYSTPLYNVSYCHHMSHFMITGMLCHPDVLGI